MLLAPEPEGEELKELVGEKKTLEETLAKNTVEIKESRTQLASLRDKLRRAEEQAQDLRTEMDQNKDLNEAAQKKSEALDKRNTDLKGMVEHLRAELEEQKRQLLEQLLSMSRMRREADRKPKSDQNTDRDRQRI